MSDRADITTGCGRLKASWRELVRQWRLAATVEHMNRAGRELEKAGDLDLALQVYRLAIKIGRTA